jgi:hypothetical protein
VKDEIVAHFLALESELAERKQVLLEEVDTRICAPYKQLMMERVGVLDKLVTNALSETPHQFLMVRCI